MSISDDEVEAALAAFYASRGGSDNAYIRANFTEDMRAALRAAAKVRAIREGDGEWVMVPREPTQEMIAAGSEARPYIEEGERDEHTDLNTEGTYAAMIAASPIPTTGGDGE